MENSNTPSKLYLWLIIILLSIIWGSSFILIKKSLLALSPYEVGALRILITAISLSPALWIHRKTIEWKNWPIFLLLAITGSGIPFILYPLAETHIDSSLAGVLNSLTPLFTLIFSVLIFKNKSNLNQNLGVVLGFLGAIVLVAFNDNEVENTHYFYAFLVLVAAMLYGLNANLVKHFFQNTKAIIITSFSFALLAPAALVFILLENTLPNLMEHPEGVKSFWAVMILALIGTSLSTIVFFKLVQKTTAVFSASVAYLIPIVAIFLGVFDGEIFGISQFVGTFIIFIALKVISSKTK